MILADTVYVEMCKRLLWLSCLEEAGVDQWEGVDLAHMLYAERCDEVEQGGD